MPVTPLHMGPGMAIKAIAGERFSLTMFGLAQVAIDLEPLIGIIRKAPELHGWTHTYLGATLIAVLVLFLGRPLCIRIVRWWNAELRRNALDWLASRDGIGWGAAAAGAFIGTWSHVALDSIMHLDMAPLRPFAAGNALLLATTVDTLYLACLIAGVLGVLLWVGIAYGARSR
ncbi:MAG: hypothetical protein H7Y14_05150 [Burkholderiales bacterium]|nr:hypothetical protein [Burkholderiales bacterium]